MPCGRRAHRPQCFQEEGRKPNVVLQRSALNREGVDADRRSRKCVGGRCKRQRFARPDGNAKAKKRECAESAPGQSERTADDVERACKEFGTRRIPPVARYGGPQRVRLRPGRRVGKMIGERIAVQQRTHQLWPCHQEQEPQSRRMADELRVRARAARNSHRWAITTQSASNAQQAIG